MEGEVKYITIKKVQHWVTNGNMIMGRQKRKCRGMSRQK